MAEPDESTPDGAAEPTSLLDQALESLKRHRGDADESSVTNDAPTRMNWNSVTDAEADSNPSEPSSTTDASAQTPTETSAATPVGASGDASFRFDLGSALARLDGDAPDEPPPPAGQASTGEPPTGEPPTGELPQRDPASAGPAVPQRAVQGGQNREAPADGDASAGALPQRNPGATAAPLPRREPAAPAPADQPLPRRDVPAARATGAGSGVATARARAEQTERGYRTNTGRGSVFDDAAPAPSLPTQPRPSTPVEPVAPVIPPGAMANLPTLPAASPGAPAPMAKSASTTPTAPDIHAVRSYQLKAQREQRRSRLFGRTLLVILLLGGAVAAALTFGRSYLFPTEWDTSLTPIVNEIQETRGDEFVEAVPLEVLPADEYASVVLELSVGPDWSERMPEWRALGVATGSADAPAITEAVVAWRPAVYDPASGQIVQVADGDPEATRSALRFALEEAFERQHGASPDDSFEAAAPGVLGVTPLEAINSQAIDRELLAGSGGFEVGTEAQVPLPLVYQFGAIDTLGEPLVAGAGPEASAWSFGDTYPESVLGATDVPRNRAAAGLAPEGTESLADPVALGMDNWTLIWRNRLPDRTVERMTTLVTADAYRPVQQGGTRCFVGTLQASSETAAADLLGSMARWVANGPDAAGATATLVAPTTVELFACDPGADAGYVVDPSAVATVLGSQIARL